MATPLSLIADGQSPSAATSSAEASDSILPRKVVVLISTVNRFFPEVTREMSTGRNLTAIADAKATWSVIYTNINSSKKVTITVDEYAASDGSSAYQEAVAKSETVLGFKSVPADNLGQSAFIGTVTQGGETHIGLGVLHGTLIVGATLAGYDLTPENTGRLIALTRDEERVAKAAWTETDTNSRCGFEYFSWIIRHSHCFRLRKMKSREYLETRVQPDHARQRERRE